MSQPAANAGLTRAVLAEVHLGATGAVAELRRRIEEAVALLPGLPPADPADPQDPRTLTCSWLLDLAATSRRSYFLALADWLLWCARHDRDPLRARRADLDQWKAGLTAQRRGKGNTIALVPPAANTVRKRLAALSSWLRYLQDNEEGTAAGGAARTVTNPAAHARRPPPPARSRYPALSAEELAGFLSWLQARAQRLGSEAAWRDAAMFTLMFHTGLRTAAVLNAQINDLRYESDGTGRYLVLHYRRKGGATDWVPLTEQVVTLVQGYLAVRAVGAGVAVEDLNGHLFVSTPHPHRPELTGGLSCRQNRVFDHFRVLARQAGLATWQTLTLHSTRRTAGTLALASGATLAQVQDLLGHADPRTTRGYDDARHRLTTSPVHTIAAALTRIEPRADADGP